MEMLWNGKKVKKEKKKAIKIGTVQTQAIFQMEKKT